TNQNLNQQTHPAPTHANTRATHAPTHAHAGTGHGTTHTSEQDHHVTADTTARKHPDPSRTRKLSQPAPMVLHPTGCGRVGRRRTTFHSGATARWPLNAFPGPFRIPAARPRALSSGTALRPQRRFVRPLS